MQSVEDNPALRFREGLLWLEGEAHPRALTSLFHALPNGRLVAPAYRYAVILREAERAQIPLLDGASRFATIDVEEHVEPLAPFDFQIEAIKG